MIFARISGLFACVCLLVCLGDIGLAHAVEDEAPDPTHREETEFILGPSDDFPLKLAHGFLARGSVRLFVDGHRWLENEDFRVQTRTGLIIPLRPWSSGPEKALVVIRYHFLPVSIPPRRDLRPVSKAPKHDPVTGRITTKQPSYEENMWGSNNLVVSGSKTVQVSSGNRREMTVDQNLRLTIMGQLTDDISVRAFLSDDNLPVIPEGNTEELRDIDKVLVEMKASNWSATLGDFIARRSGTTFGDYRRKLQGFSLEAHPGQTEFGVLAGAPRGLYRTLQIRGQESNQGPYYLGATGGGESLFLVAGSERVTLDGETLTRGSDRDYTIDYVVGTITFTYRRLITAESTIVVEYEQGEGPYGRTVIGGGGGAFFNVPGLMIPGSIHARIIREKDDPHRLRTGELSAADEAALVAAGDDPLKAIASGVQPVGQGEGLYDEALDGDKTIYVYNPNGGDFELSLFYVGTDRGNYVLDFLTETGRKVFVYKGEGRGNYLIGRPLDRPQMQGISTLTSTLGDSSGTHLKAEWNFGDLDLNQLSEIDNEDNQTQAGRISGNLNPVGIGLGTLGIEGFWEKQDAGFRPFQVHKTVFDYDKWGLSDRARRYKFLDERDQESGVTSVWKVGKDRKSLDISGNWGRLVHGENLEADQLSGKATWALAGGAGQHMEQRATAKDEFDPLDIDRVSRLHKVRWTLGPVQPDVSYKFQSWQDGAINGQRATGFRLEETGVGIKSPGGGGLDWRLNFQRGLADSLYTGRWDNKRDSRTYQGGVSTSLTAGMRLVGEGTVRNVLQSDGPEQTTRLGRINISGLWTKSASDWSLGYRLDNSRTQVLDRQIVFVGEGQGDYNENGNYLGPGQGDFDLVQAVTDSLLATTAVVADLQWRQGFAFLGKDKIYGAWSLNTLASAEGRSTVEDVGKLLTLNPSAIFDPEHTVLGNFNLTQELNLLQHIPTVDLRGKFEYRETMDRQYAGHPEDRLNRGYQINTTVNVGRRTSLRTKLLQRFERQFSTESTSSSRRSYESLGREFELGYGYRPTADLRLNFAVGYLTRRDQVSEVSQKEYALHPNARLKFMGQWSILGDARLSEVKSDEPAGSVRPWFYPLTGRNVESSFRLGWEPSTYLDVGLSYFARKQGERGWQHDLRLESTARF
jgi:hypothetical protein